MKNTKNGIVLGFMVMILIMISTLATINFIKDTKTNNTLILKEDDNWNLKLEDIESDEVKIKDNQELYEKFDDSNVEDLYITVLPPSSENFVTFNELNTNVNITNEVYNNDGLDPVSNIILSTTPEHNIKEENATIEIRGQSSRSSEQKSYKIKSLDNNVIWKDFKIVNLNKHFRDTLKIRNKLSFDYMEQIDNITSYRTKFVRLNIKDLSQGIDNVYKSYGLYTFIEQPNKEYLKNHNLNPSGYFYKAEFFEFYRYDDKIKLNTDPLYKKEDLESILEVRGNEDNSKLIEMLDAINDYSRDINDVVNQYFDEENMLTWLGVNILINNNDTNSRNFLIYSQLNSDKWFFIPWDYDGAWNVYGGEDSYQFGLANYWGMVIFNRYFKYEENINKLSKKIEELSEIINEENTITMLETYYNLIGDVIYSAPDSQYMKVPKEKYLEEVEYLGKLTENNKNIYYKDLERPMPFFLYEYEEYEKDNLRFSWQSSYDIKEDNLTYEFILSEDPKLKNVVERVNTGTNIFCDIPKVISGKYYWTVIAYDSQGNFRKPFNKFEGDTSYLGIKEVEIK